MKDKIHIGGFSNFSIKKIVFIFFQSSKRSTIMRIEKNTKKLIEYFPRLYFLLSLVAQRQSEWLLTTRSLVQIQPEESLIIKLKNTAALIWR